MLAVTSWLRGRLEQSIWVVIFPLLAGLFDFIPGFSWIPLLPTLFYVLALIFGARGTAKVRVTTDTGN